MQIPDKVSSTIRWLPSYFLQKITRRLPPAGERHLIFALADHFEPSIIPESQGGFASIDVQRQRLEKWCGAYSSAFSAWRDSAGFPFVHTYFYPAEQSETSLLKRLAEHCHEGWGEIEIQLHHGVQA